MYAYDQLSILLELEHSIDVECMFSYNLHIKDFEPHIELSLSSRELPTLALLFVQ